MFGNIFYRKRKLENHIRGVQRALECRSLEELVSLEKDLIMEWEIVLAQEESFWLQ